MAPESGDPVTSYKCLANINHINPFVLTDIVHSQRGGMDKYIFKKKICFVCHGSLTDIEQQLEGHNRVKWKKWLLI